MYRYRRLTPDERAEAVRQRQERGYPLHSPPHPFRHAGHYLVTGVNFEHAHILASSMRRTEFETHLLQEATNAGIDVCGWVILPNHYHILVDVDTLEQVSATLQHLHGTTARVWNVADGLTGKRKIWYKYYDRAIRDDNHFFRALNYIHFNPVKHGYVDSPYDWPWTSVESYVRLHGREWMRDLWRSFPPGEFGAGWDDE